MEHNSNKTLKIEHIFSHTKEQNAKEMKKQYICFEKYTFMLLLHLIFAPLYH